MTQLNIVADCFESLYNSCPYINNIKILSHRLYSLKENIYTKTTQCPTININIKVSNAALRSWNPIHIQIDITIDNIDKSTNSNSFMTMLTF